MLKSRQVRKGAEQDDYCNLFIVAIFTGMRQGELPGLGWDCADFKTGIITVRQQLEQALAGSLWDNKFNLVFTDASGKYLVRRTVVKHFKKITKRAGIPGSTICATASLSLPCTQAMTLRLYKQIWATQPHNSPWMCTVM